MKAKSKDSGKLRIGDDWNAIRIIALSQSNPLKAIAEFVENSIDAHAKTITITRGKEHGAHYLAIKDDGGGVPRDDDGLPDFKYVATRWNPGSSRAGCCTSCRRSVRSSATRTLSYILRSPMRLREWR
jgi:Histidine kinase-, DNA gyrase B-, and HSP90-like ATPase